MVEEAKELSDECSQDYQQACVGQFVNQAKPLVGLRNGRFTPRREPTSRSPPDCASSPGGREGADVYQKA